ncbi:hypothetical protein JTE90_010590 [Oedothorax gibbosus]|uniref:NTR domain-containing protein n=1 Tax=Oedothorax gibbosus TaxID=931172 RepID=A0AAV6V6S9_9ARAC|nr:hypothetical protein JTE90_010590 [Oedothorax gibbosus]
MKCDILIRWCDYLTLLLFSSYISEGAFGNPTRSDSKRNGDTLNSSTSLHNSTDPVYSPWSSWTECSVTCGTGISSRTRTCLKSGYNSRGVYVPLCHGEYAEHKICNLKICLVKSDVREYQCSQYNNQIIAGKSIKSWIPANGGPNPCELRCEATTEKLVYGFGKASDGTPCPPLGVCLDGRCLRQGCDSLLGSGIDLDMCGVCGGRNSSCVHYKDVYEGQPSSSESRSPYYEIVVIPSGVRNLIIRQPLGKNILALQDRSKGIIFNGDQNQNKYGGHYEISGSIVEYGKLDVLAEQLLAKGPLTQELKVLVLLRSHNPGIYYEYWLPKQNHNPRHTHYPHPTPSLPTIQMPRKSQSYSVPFYNSNPTQTAYVPNRHPTKPPFAYGFGEKPQIGLESPVFRHILSTSPPTSETKSAVAVKPFEPKFHLPFKRGVLKPKPARDFYATYRNASRTKSPSWNHQAEAPSNDDGFPDSTQGDSSSSNGRHQNVISNSVVEDKKPKFSLSKQPKNFGIVVNKRVEDSAKNKVPNGRLKYSLEGNNSNEAYVNSSDLYTSPSLTINVLPDNVKSKYLIGKKADETLKPRPTRGGGCEPCQRSRNQLQHFCISDFVIRALVTGFEFVHGETRYELDVQQSFKNTLSLLPKEYVWSPDTCRCPKLRPGKEYIVMGRSDNTYRKRESRLLVDRTSFVRTFNPKYVRRLLKLRKEQQKKCRKFS